MRQKAKNCGSRSEGSGVDANECLLALAADHVALRVRLGQDRRPFALGAGADARGRLGTLGAGLARDAL